MNLFCNISLTDLPWPGERPKTVHLQQIKMLDILSSGEKRERKLSAFDSRESVKTGLTAAAKAIADRFGVASQPEMVIAEDLSFAALRYPESFEIPYSLECFYVFLRAVFLHTDYNGEFKYFWDAAEQVDEAPADEN